MNSPFKQSSDAPSGSSTPERQQSTGQSVEPEAGPTTIEQAQSSSLLPPQTAAEKAVQVKADRAAAAAQKQNEELIQLVGNLESLDWKKIKPHIMAQILTKIPYRGKKDDPPYYLSPIQALIFAIEAYRMGLSPLSDQCFFNKDSHKVNATLSGKKAMSRDMGLNFGPPKFERVSKPFVGGKKIAGFTEDIGYKCTMEVKGFRDSAEYTAYLSEWYMPYSPVWKEKPEHMLQTRAQEKAISSASGVGASELPSPHDIEPLLSGTPELSLPSFTGEVEK
jgi:hypothetical protein